MLFNNYRFTTVALLALALVLNGCLGGPSPTPATRFYVLNSIYSEENVNRPEPIMELGENVSLGIGPIRLSQVLDRPQIILRTSQNEIQVADLDRWAAPLKENITNVLTDNLTTLLSTGSILKFPWKTTLPIEYQIVLEITRFDGMPGGNVDLRARWGILGENGRKVYAKAKTALTEPIGGDTITEMVSAQSRLVARLSLEIAEEIKQLEETGARQ
ncbi:MAG: PqiC family protein [Desulfobacterales bacterium]|jgi:uncharacterized lipoprotein YmbA